MDIVTIHESGEGGDKLRVDSYGNGWAYNFHFGEAGSPMRNVYMQDDDALAIRAAFDAAEEVFPETDTRDVWLMVLDPYL